MVMLSTRNIKTKRLSAKLDNTYIGPFLIVRVIHDSSIYELGLTRGLKALHPIFYPSLLLLLIRDLFPKLYPG
jgi:hypothetical protein